MTYRANADLDVFKDPDVASGPVFTLRQGDKLLLWPEEEDELFQKIQVPRFGRRVTGYVRVRDIRGQKSGRGRPLGHWGWGGGATYTILSQKKSPFTTDDQVKYTPGEFKSTVFSPAFIAQYQRRDFWRMYLQLKEAHFTGSATTNISNTTAQSVAIDIQFFSASFEKVWSFSRRTPWYMGFNFELAKGRSMKVTLNGKELETATEDIPFYTGFEAVGGGQWFIGKRYSLFSELRYGVIANQDPMIYEMEFAAGLLYWP